MHFDEEAIASRREILTGSVMLGGALLLAGCQSKTPADVPPYYRDLARVNAVIDQATAQQMISQYRENNGRGRVVADPALITLAQQQARVIAAADDIRASLYPQNQLKNRLDAIGESKSYGVENVSAGYRTLAEAFSGWRESPTHNKVMLDERVTRMGIATAYSPSSKYKVFWSLVLVSPRG
ncbi:MULTISPECIES: CAP domain-containing protein [Pannonibacter]|uniref:CAP domain-containing protein n=1 Tax=Pannonibacter TaxID=227873 RepID=UPI0009E47ABE|nr:CAP domain-containing protein [Pannonibacter phragmitetus]